MKKKNGLMISLDQKISFHPINGERCQEDFKLKMGIYANPLFTFILFFDSIGSTFIGEVNS